MSILNENASSSPDWADETEHSVLDAALQRLPSHGRWDQRLVDLAASDIGLTPAAIRLVLPNGPRDLAALLSQRHDQRTITRLTRDQASDLRIREKITQAVATRIEVAMLEEAAVRRSLAFLSLPAQGPLASRLMWASADLIWRWAGDVATDFNHYSKRAILSTVLASTLFVRLSAGKEAADRHLAARIDGIMGFEKLKSRLKVDPESALSRWVGGLSQFRYGDKVKTETVLSAD